MGLLGFSFGKKRRATKRRTSKKHHRKPPSKLLRLCRKYRVKATKKVGKKKVYKSVSSLKKSCLRKARALRKKLLKAHKKSMKHHKKTHRRKMHSTRRRSHKRRDAFGEDEMSFGNRRLPMFGMKYKRDAEFGKRRRAGARVSKKAAMKAFRSFYKRHCAGSRRRFGFGDGGNPSLYNSMGYEFCPSGQGGVLGFNSTGLFPSPCTSASTGAMPSMGSMAPSMAPSTSSYGRRRRRSAAIGHKKRKSSKRCMAAGCKKRDSEIGARRRRSTRRRVSRRV